MADTVTTTFAFCRHSLYQHPDIAAMMHILRVFVTLVVLVIIIWLSRKSWYDEETGDINTWSLLGIVLVTVFLTSLVLSLFF